MPPLFPVSLRQLRPPTLTLCPHGHNKQCELGGERGHLWVTKVTGASVVSQKGGAVWPGINPEMNFKTLQGVGGGNFS